MKEQYYLNVRGYLVEVTTLSIAHATIEVRDMLEGYDEQNNIRIDDFEPLDDYLIGHENMRVLTVYPFQDKY